MLSPTFTTRRQFLKSATAASTVFAAPALLRSATSPNERIHLAFIGTGSRGGNNFKALTEQTLVDVDVVALCDVDERQLRPVVAKYPKARTYKDFRRLFDEAGDIDAVVVSTPEHTHAYATLPALTLGKHVYCEKPLTHNVKEARLIAHAAAKANVATQMGTQIHATANYRRVVELVQSGAIGPVSEVHVWVHRAWGLQSKAEAEANNDVIFVTERPAEAMMPPDYLDWDLWLGPAPKRPYHDVYFPGPKWYRWWDFGSGTMSDLGSHWIDLPFWALNLDAPRTIESFGIPPHPEIAPASMHVTYEYGPRGALPACKLTWYQGTHRPPILREGRIPDWNRGCLFIGTKGMLLANYRSHVLLPEEKYRDFQPPEPWIAESPEHHEEWLIACQTGAQTGSPFDYAGRLTEANHLGNVAYRVGQMLEWDSDNLRVTNCPEAEQYLGRVPRKGWSLG